MSKKAYTIQYVTANNKPGITTIYHYSKTEALEEFYKLFPGSTITYFHGC